MAGVGVWAGWMVAGFIAPMIPRPGDEKTAALVDKVVRFGITGLVTVAVLRMAGKGRK